MEYIDNDDEVDKYCLKQFPEMLLLFQEDDLKQASSQGTYVFHGLYFMPMVVKHRSKPEFMKRVSSYVEYLASFHNSHLEALAEIGILEGLVSRGIVEIEPHLNSHSRVLLERVLRHFDVDKERWRAST